MEKLLIVDDDEAIRRLMRLELCDTFEVIDSGEPERGLALALEHKPDAILLDLRMPNYSGYELLQTFTTFSHTQKIPIIIVSGEAGGGRPKSIASNLERLLISKNPSTSQPYELVSPKWLRCGALRANGSARAVACSPRASPNGQSGQQD